jgi:hypothetical protein
VQSRRRLARAALVGAALAVLTLAGHTAGMGRVDPLGVTLVAVLASMLALVTSGRSVGLGRLLALLLAGQGLLHLILAFTSSHHGHPAIGGPSASAMLAGHGLAAVIAAVVVRHADDLIDRWGVLVGTAVGRRRPTTLRIVGPVSPMRIPAAPMAGIREHLEHPVARRGPPTSAVLALA